MDRLPITKEIMQVDTNSQIIDMQQIDNRRFMYNPTTGVLVLGQQYTGRGIVFASHAQELADAGITDGFDDFVRGWVGTGRSYPQGVIHFAPNVDEKYTAMYEHAFDTLEMFARNGALDGTVIRGFGSHWEQPLESILSPPQQAEHMPSAQFQHELTPEKKTGKHPKAKQIER